jgi:hypothetical protein
MISGTGIRHEIVSSTQCWMPVLLCHSVTSDQPNLIINIVTMAMLSIILSVALALKYTNLI